MEGAIGIDRQLTKTMTGNVTYVFSQGIHQYFTDNLSAAALFPAADAEAGIYPSTPVSEPGENDLQYQSGGFYREHQVMATVRATYRHFSFFTNYTYSDAMGDTSGYSVRFLPYRATLDWITGAPPSMYATASCFSATSCCPGRSPSLPWWWRTPERLITSRLVPI